MIHHARIARERERRSSRRGGVYPMVLIVSAAAATAALTGLAVRSATDQRTQTTADLASTRLAARSGIEAVLQVIGENKNWRTDYGSGKTFSYTIDEATVAVILSDETDADLADSGTDQYTLTSVANTKDATTTLRVTVTPISDTYRERVIEEEPIRYWPLDETSGFTADDLMDQGNGGFSNPAALGDVTGYDGLPAMRMDSIANFAWVPHNNAYFLEKGTVMCWVFCNGNSSGDQMILAKSNGGAREGDFTLSLVGDSLDIQATMVDNKGTSQTVSLGNLPVRTWTHVAVTFYNELEGFVNGVLVTKDNSISTNWSTNDGDSPGNTHNLNIGVMYRGILPSQSLNGSVRDVAIFDSDLSEGKISDLIEGSQKPFGIQPDAWAWIAN